MGLDWHSMIVLEGDDAYDAAYTLWPDKDEEEIEDKLASRGGQLTVGPCFRVGAPRMRDRKDFRQCAEERLETARQIMYERASRGKDSDLSDSISAEKQQRLEELEAKTVEDEMREIGEAFDCDNCPLLKELNDSNAKSSPFVGMTVSACDFRGKLISSDTVISEDLRDEAYEHKDPYQMIAYADRLEAEIERLRAEGYLDKDPYDVYSQEYDEVKNILDSSPEWDRVMGPKMTPEEYEQQPHEREVDIRRAIHWLRILASHNVSMDTSY